MAVTLNTRHLESFIGKHEYEGAREKLKAAHQTLTDGTGLGGDFLGWLRLPETFDREEFQRIKAAADRIKGQADVLIVIGIGGSYLGARTAIEFVKGQYYNSLPKDTPDIYFVGNSLSPAYLNDILKLCEGRELAVNVISKSGTTTEPALAFRVFRDLMESRYGKEEARRRIYCTTDKARGTLKELADKEGYETFVIPDDVGGRFSVLTPVGLLPIAVAGCDIDALMEGAAQAMTAYEECDPDKNPCYRYAAIRDILYGKGKTVEVLVSYEPALTMLGEWYKQLYGESQGKDGKGLFPASMVFSTDLHSLGQYVQDGRRDLFETVVCVDAPPSDYYIEKDSQNLDGLNFLSGQPMSAVNRKAFEGTVLAHVEGGVPNVVLTIPRMDEKELGWLIYFMEKACAVSGYMLGVNPFDQPGVESYKKNMFALLGKPGFEELRSRLEEQLG